MTKLEAIRLLLDSGHFEYQSNRYCKDGSYTLAHGEYERPDYQIRKVRGKDDYEIYLRRYFLPSTFTNHKNHVLNSDDLWLLQELADSYKEAL